MLTGIKIFFFFCEYHNQSCCSDYDQDNVKHVVGFDHVAVDFDVVEGVVASAPEV